MGKIITKTTRVHKVALSELIEKCGKFIPISTTCGTNRWSNNEHLHLCKLVVESLFCKKGFGKRHKADRRPPIFNLKHVYPVQKDSSKVMVMIPYYDMSTTDTLVLNLDDVDRMISTIYEGGITHYKIYNNYQ